MASAVASSLKSLTISSDANAQVFALLEQDQFHKALKLAQADTAKTVPNIYIAYAQYKVGREEECLVTLGDAKDRASRHLRAQALYRLERVSNSDLHNLRADTQVTAEEADIAVNEAAIAAQHAALSKKATFPVEPSDPSHEFLFNQSIFEAYSGRVDRAIQTLERAITSLKALDLDTADYEAELAPIKAQIAHLTSNTELNAEAHRLQSDSSTKFLTGLNCLQDQNPYAVYKAYHDQVNLKPAARLFSFQDRFVAYDKIVAMHAIGLNVKKAVQRYITKYRDVDTERCSSLQTLLYSRTTRTSLQEALKKNPDNIEALVALISKTVGQKRGVSKSLDILKRVPEEVRHQNPGLLGIQCALSDLTDAPESNQYIQAALKNATGEIRIELLGGLIQRAIASTSTKSNETAQVDAWLDELLRLDPTNKVARSATLVLRPESNPDQMLDLPDLSSIDVTSLESNAKRPREDEATVPIMQKKRKTKSEEQIRAEKTLDPERWLPKRDRSTYRPSKKDKMKSKNAAGGHQGGLVDESLSTQGPASGNQPIKTGEVARKKKKSNKKGKK